MVAQTVNTASTGRWHVPGDRPWFFDSGRLVRSRWDREAEAYRDQVVLPWAPQVLDVYQMPGDGPERRGESRFRIAVGDQVRLVTDDELESGRAWRQWSEFPGRNVREALAAYVSHQAAHLERRSPVAVWEDTRLILPDLTVVPDGYGQGPADRTSARELLSLASTLPKVALLMGFSAGAPYVSTMRPQQSFWVHLTGAGRMGKTSAMTAAACLWGEPDQGKVVRPWNVTPRGVSVYLGRLGILPSFRDELGAAEYKPAVLKNLILSTCQGNVRDVSGRSGDMRSGAPWHGALISTGNVSVLSQISDEAISARIVEIATPFTPDASTADRLSLLAGQAAGYGWHLAQEYHDLPQFFGDLAEAHRDLNPPSGGVPLTIARNLTVGIAGAAWLERAADVTGLRDAALGAAIDILEMLTAELVEMGISPGARLLEALEGDMMARPSAWPKAGADVPSGVTVSGYRLGGKRIGVIPAALEVIARDGGLETSRPAVRELRDQGVLERGDGKNLARRVPVGSSRPRLYVFALPHVDQDQAPASAPEPAPAGLVPAQAPAPAAPEPAVKPARVQRAERRAQVSDREAFARAVATRYPDEELDTAALERAATGFSALLDIAFTGSPAQTGMMLFHKLQSQHGSKPQLEQVEIVRPDHVVNAFNRVDQNAWADDYRAVSAVDVNSQYLAAAGSATLGTGTPTEIDASGFSQDKVAALCKCPGYVQLLEPLPAPMGAYAPAGAWITTPYAAYLVKAGRLPRIGQALIWERSRRWLDTWSKTVREARSQMMGFLSPDDPAPRYALAVLKQLYSGFLGGMLRSEQYNRTTVLRPDWSDMVVGLSWANLERAVDKADRPALGVMKDTVYYGVSSVGELPKGITLTDQPGKFDPAKVKSVPFGFEIAQAVEAARPAKLRDAVNKAWKEATDGQQ